jgi:hypothetical protein
MKTFTSAVYVNTQDCLDFFKTWRVLYNLNDNDIIRVIITEGDDETYPEYQSWNVQNYQNHLQELLLLSYDSEELQEVM